MLALALRLGFAGTCICYPDAGGFAALRGIEPPLIRGFGFQILCCGVSIRLVQPYPIAGCSILPAFSAWVLSVFVAEDACFVRVYSVR